MEVLNIHIVFVKEGDVDGVYPLDGGSFMQVFEAIDRRNGPNRFILEYDDRGRCKLIYLSKEEFRKLEENEY